VSLQSNKEAGVIVSPVMGGMIWKVAGREIDLSQRGMIMGVLNVTPDSFSDGGEFFSAKAAIEHGEQMAGEGAHFIDVGGESTRPGAEPTLANEELRRVLPVIEELRKKIPSFISIDTSKSEVARAALDAGASIINDVTGGRGDAQMFSTAAERNAALIIMHMQGEPRTMQLNPHYDDVVLEVVEFFRQRYARALQFGIDPMAIAFDPGIGFGKTLEHNLKLLGNLERLRVHDRPLVVGVSRKGFLGKIMESKEMSDRLAPTIGLTALLRARGANILRVHDVRSNVAALRTADAILEAAK
jgi:dihydropteroate synthase